MALFVANALGFGGEQMHLAAQLWWILGEGGSKTEMGLATGLRIVPVLVLTLYAGVFTDGVDGKRLMLAKRCLLTLIALITAVILVSGDAEIWHVVVLSTIAGALIVLGTMVAGYDKFFDMDIIAWGPTTTSNWSLSMISSRDRMCSRYTFC